MDAIQDRNFVGWRLEPTTESESFEKLKEAYATTAAQSKYNALIVAAFQAGRDIVTKTQYVQDPDQFGREWKELRETTVSVAQHNSTLRFVVGSKQYRGGLLDDANELLVEERRSYCVKESTVTILGDKNDNATKNKGLIFAIKYDALSMPERERIEEEHPEFTQEMVAAALMGLGVEVVRASVEPNSCGGLYHKMRNGLYETQHGAVGLNMIQEGGIATKVHERLLGAGIELSEGRFNAILLGPLCQETPGLMRYIPKADVNADYTI